MPIQNVLAGRETPHFVFDLVASDNAVHLGYGIPFPRPKKKKFVQTHFTEAPHEALGSLNPTLFGGAQTTNCYQ
jgi:hypothetical protein